jgi:chromosome segregation and condensation protein ScpB
MRAFVRLRELLSTHKSVLQRLDELEQKYQGHDAEIKVVFEAIRKLIEAPVRPQRRIGFSPSAQSK